MTNCNHLLINQQNILRKLHELISCDDFILYGGQAVDRLVGVKTDTSDFDIAINDGARETVAAVLWRLKKNNWKILEPYREYLIYRNHKVLIIYATKASVILDICFIDDYDLIGLYNIESLYWRFPQLDYVDNFNNLESLKLGDIKLVREFKSENPLLLVSRFMYLCSKYDINLLSKPNFLALLVQALRQEPDVRSDQHNSCVSSLFKSILKAKDRRFYSEQLRKTGLIEHIIPELSEAIDLLASQKKWKILDGILSKKALIMFFAEFMTEKNRRKFFSSLDKLSTRVWDNDDRHCRIII